MAIALSSAQSAEFAELINEVARAPQNQLDATSIERMAKWAVASEAFTSAADFIEQFKTAPFGTLLNWSLLGYFAAGSLTAASVASLTAMVASMNANYNRPLDANLIDQLLPVLQDADFLVNDTRTKNALTVFPYAGLMAFAWWMNVTDVVIPFDSWLDAEAAGLVLP